MRLDVSKERNSKQLPASSILDYFLSVLANASQLAESNELGYVSQILYRTHTLMHSSCYSAIKEIFEGCLLNLRERMTL